MLHKASKNCVKLQGFLYLLPKILKYENPLAISSCMLQIGYQFFVYEYPTLCLIFKGVINGHSQFINCSSNDYE